MPDFQTVDAVQPHVLCNVCRRFSAEYLVFRERRSLGPTEFKAGDFAEFGHHRTLDELRESSLSRCHLCTLILQAIDEPLREKPYLYDSRKVPIRRKETATLYKEFGPRDGQQPTILDHISLVITTWDLVSYGPMHNIEIHAPLQSNQTFRTDNTPSLEIHAFPPDQSRNPKNHHAPEPAGVEAPAKFSYSTASRQSFDLARSWLAHCLSNHHKCREGLHGRPKIPTRLLDTRLVEEDPKRLRLCLGLDLPPNTQYLTLSHCWGTTPTKRLAENTLETFLGGFSFDELPLTFQHAVVIAQKLRVRYLWIDSLCIIQDSSFDWERESAKMGEVYSGSLCTIAALGSDSSTSGCFAERNPLSTRPCRILGDEKSGLYVHSNLYGTDEWRHGGNDPASGPLHQRAWVVQERLLSPRTLYYGTKEIFWECLTGDYSEAWPQGILWDWSNIRLYRRPKEMFSSLLDVAKGQNPLHLRSGLRQIIEEYNSIALRKGCEIHSHTDPTYLFQLTYGKIISLYTSCQLTFQRDKLPALSGIIQLVQNASKLTPVAGLWKELILPNLLWYSISPRPRPDFGGNLRPPTWSWASVGGQIEFAYPRLHVRGEEALRFLPLPLRFKLDWKAKVDEVSQKLLRLSGCIRPIRREEDQKPKRRFYNYEAQSVKEVWLWDEPFDQKWEEQGQLHAILILWGSSTPPAEDLCMDVGILLVPVDSSLGAWRRVGFFQQYYWQSDSDPVFSHADDEAQDLYIS